MTDQAAKVTPILLKKQPEGTLTMAIIAGNFWLVGRLVGGNKLTKPRIFSIIEDIDPMTKQAKIDPATGRPVTLIQMAPLPGTPPFYRMSGGEGTYPVPERETNYFELYNKVTDPSVDPG